MLVLVPFKPDLVSVSVYGVANIGFVFMTWILVRQEAHTLTIGDGHACAFSTGPGPNIS